MRLDDVEHAVAQLRSSVASADEILITGEATELLTPDWRPSGPTAQRDDTFHCARYDDRRDCRNSGDY